MYKNEDQLDNLFRKTANHLQVEFDERDWDRMSRMLDQDDRKRMVKRRMVGALAVAALAGLLLIITGKFSPEHKIDLSVRPPTPVKSNAAVESKTQKEAIVRQVVTLKKIAEPGPSTTRGDNTRGTNHVLDPKRAIRQMEPRPTKAIFSKEAMGSISNGSPLPQNSLPSDSTALTTTAQLNHQPEDKDEEKNVDCNDSIIVVVEKYPPEEEKKQHAEKLPWSAALVFAPDFSSVNMKEYTSPGQTAGVVGYCPLSSKLSIGAGFTQSRKVYRANGKDYNVPAGYWDRYTNGVIPQNVSASCTIVEMALQMRFQKTMDRSNVHAMAGVSSYYMYDESYRYSFATPTYGSSGFDSEEGSMYLFKVASLSVGYERYLNPYLLIGVEPYVKLPMAEMGWSNVKLFSAGMFLTLRYTFKRSERSVNDPSEKKLGRSIKHEFLNE